MKESSEQQNQLHQRLTEICEIGKQRCVESVDHSKGLSKTELRRSHLKTRQTLSVEAWKQKSDRLCTHIQNSPQFTQANTILAYFSYRQEPDLTPLFTNPKKWGFPRCIGNQLSWHTWTAGDTLQTGKFGILEPHPDSPKLEPSEIDLILLPAVACDTNGYRLGYGGGYYDRMLSLPEWASKPAIGIIFEFAYLPQLPIDSWDQPLHGICTEIGLKMTKKNKNLMDLNVLTAKNGI